MEKPWMRIFQASTSPCTGSLAAFAVRPRRPRCPVGCFHLKFASTSLWSSVGVSAMDVVMVDDGGADLFKICTLLIGSFCNDSGDVSSDSVRDVENRAERTWSSRRGPSALRCTDIWSVCCSLRVFHT
ncbi:Contactin-associated protein-like [Trichinella spiralis]|uniref:Contactin-associated protein-like n=1 Tax=Trichinella spiralis TaxID=6334 RepID=A0ABR3KIX4_TRISP